MCGPTGCDEGGFCIADPVIQDCGTIFCGAFDDTCGNSGNCGACTTAGTVCLAGRCCFPGQVVGSTGGVSFCCTPRPNSCALDGVACGNVFDSFCGANLDCGNCPTGFTCTSSQCVAPPPKVPAAPPWVLALMVTGVLVLGGSKVLLRWRR